MRHCIPEGGIIPGHGTSSRHRAPGEVTAAAKFDRLGFYNRRFRHSVKLKFKFSVAPT